MATNKNSNASEVNRALLRAVLLTLSLMLFTGFGVALFPASKYLEGCALGDDYRETKASLHLLQEDLRQLFGLLSTLEETWDQITTLDEQWERESSSIARGKLKTQINGLESEAAGLAAKLEQARPDTLGRKVARAYGLLLKSRASIWDMRYNNQKELIAERGGNAADACEERLDDLQDRNRDLARRLEAEAEDIQGHTEQIKKFLNAKNRYIQEKLEQSVGDLKKMAGELRGR
ncbi:MAG: hypothetical protein H6558_21225 [Lewinellaceae bacterium]|nr:hypothetical protein [Lewinellaceae bacterium]